MMDLHVGPDSKDLYSLNKNLDCRVASSDKAFVGFLGFFASLNREPMLVMVENYTVSHLT